MRALLDDAHVHHRLARAWLGDHIDEGWASCPLTQLGCVRIMANARYANAQPAAQVALRLAKATHTAHHEFWPADANPFGTEGIDWSRVLSARHVTDVYLLSLAVSLALRRGLARAQHRLQRASRDPSPRQ